MIPAQILLVITLVMPGQTPDVKHVIHEKNLTECWADAHEFVEAGLTDAERAAGGIAVMAGCLSQPAEENKL